MRGLGFWIGGLSGLGLVAVMAMQQPAPLRAAGPQGATEAVADTGGVALATGGGAAGVTTAAVVPVLPAERAPAPAQRVHAFVPRGRAQVRTTLPATGAAYLSMVAGDAASGAPPVAAVREAGRLRLVKAGDTLDGAVVAGIDAWTLTLRAADRTVVLTRAH